MKWILEEMWFTLSVVLFYVLTHRMEGIRFSSNPDLRLKAHRRMLYFMLFCVLSAVALVCAVMAYVGLSWRAYAVFGVLLSPLTLGGYVCWSDYKQVREVETARSVLET